MCIVSDNRKIYLVRCQTNNMDADLMTKVLIFETAIIYVEEYDWLRLLQIVG